MGQHWRATGGWAWIRGDCILADVRSVSKSLTCTGRPPWQNWYFYIACVPLIKFGNAYGNIVAGDGTSTATCQNGTAADTGTFYISSG
jgi:hypothetical protein